MAPRKYVLYGATDRINYGDNLMPLVIIEFLDKYAKEQVETKNYGTIRSNLAKFKALPTLPVRKMYDDPFVEGSTVVVVGGEVLGARWGKILSFCYDFVYRARDIRVLHRFFTDKWARLFLGGGTRYPFVLSEADFKYECSVVYNSVGGPRKPLPKTKRVTESLSKARYISVRDHDSAQNLQASTPQVSAEITPDSCVLMSEFYPVDRLETMVGPEVLKFSGQTQYVFFQVGLSKSKGKIGQLADQLIAAASGRALKVCLCPIGRAPGHHDQIALAQIRDEIARRGHEELVELFPEPTIWDIMLLIARAKVYVGTSLHGVITAQSFGTPYIGINQSLKKVAQYLDSWAPPELADVHPIQDWLPQFDTVMDLVQTPSGLADKLHSLTNQQMEISRASLTKMLLP